MSFFKDFTTTSDLESRRRALEKRLEVSQATKVFEDSVDALVSGVPLAERESWAKQELEAKAFGSDPDSYVPYLSVLAVQRGESLDVLVTKILAKVAVYEAAHATLLGQYHVALRDIEYRYPEV